MLYYCNRCGAVFYNGTEGLSPHCNGAAWVPLSITAQTSEYSEAGGTITGMDVTISITGD
jgi:hypothetical protein